MNIRTENWNGHNIRFVEKEPLDWWGVLPDIAIALSLRTDKIITRLEDDHLSKVPIMDKIGRLQKTTIVNEFGIYDAIFHSRKKEAKGFRHWVYDMLKSLRQASGLEGFQVFRMLDKEHQQEAMAQLKAGLSQPVRVDFIKANTIANKAVSSLFGYPNMLKKDAMTPDMLIHRQPILDDVVNLMSINEKFGLGLSVSQTVYKKHLPV